MCGGGASRAPSQPLTPLYAVPSLVGSGVDRAAGTAVPRRQLFFQPPRGGAQGLSGPCARRGWLFLPGGED